MMQRKQREKPSKTNDNDLVMLAIMLANASSRWLANVRVYVCQIVVFTVEYSAALDVS